MNVMDVFSADEKDNLLCKLYSKSSQVKVDGNPIPYSYMTQDEYEVAVIDLFIKDELVEEVVGLSGYATYRHTSLASLFIKRGGYKQLQILKRDERRRDAGSKIFISATSSIIGIIIGAIISRLFS